MIDPTKRIAKWNVEYNTERIKATLDEMRPTMPQSVTAVTPLITAMELQVKQVCDGAGGPNGPPAAVDGAGRQAPRFTTTNGEWRIAQPGMSSPIHSDSRWVTCA